MQISAEKVQSSAVLNKKYSTLSNVISLKNFRGGTNERITGAENLRLGSL